MSLNKCKTIKDDRLSRRTSYFSSTRGTFSRLNGPWRRGETRELVSQRPRYISMNCILYARVANILERFHWKTQSYISLIICFVVSPILLTDAISIITELLKVMDDDQLFQLTNYYRERLEQGTEEAVDKVSFVFTYEGYFSVQEYQVSWKEMDYSYYWISEFYSIE